ncbi:MAG: tol-pal system protein YbgF [Marinosulfonomonas sp.]|nr:tol-pal system protein YbgF [Marinosulfonomonas sp.]
MVRFSNLVLTMVIAVAFAAPALSQSREQTLADVRQELTVLFVEMQRLKRELSTTGSVSGNVSGASTLERIDLIESELARLTAKTEQMENRISRVVQDGTNRIGDLEFRLVELEGGDVSQLGETTTLGGDTGQTDVAVQPQTDTGSTELAIGEQFDFDQAKASLDAERYQDAVVGFMSFNDTYTGGPLTGDAHYFRGQALAAMGDTANAARAYLESFSGSPNSPRAPDALHQLGVTLGKLGQKNEACIALSEVGVRFPGAAAVGDAQLAYQDLGCS